ncbi:MAG: hypothetical protein ACJAX4_001597 [Clostridium sp.]|jgi:hypothetical protein
MVYGLDARVYFRTSRRDGKVNKRYKPIGIIIVLGDDAVWDITQEKIFL